MHWEIPTAVRRERVLFVVLATAVIGYIVLRALFVPLVHDETTSFLAYAQSGAFLPFRSMWDANNHFLNSACGWLGYSIGGLHPFALRWASAAAFVLFAWSAWRIGARLGHAGVRWCMWSALLLCPLVIEYFSLFRGYGPALAFLLFALDAMMAYGAARDQRSLWCVLTSLIVANGFVLALVPLWTIVLFLLSMHIGGNRRHLLILLVSGWVPLALAIGYTFLMARYGLLYHGGTNGFVEVTVKSLAAGVFGATDPLIVASMLVVFLGGLGLLIRQAWRERAPASPGTLLAGLLVMEAIGRIAAAEIIGLNHASDRTAMHMLVIGILVVAFAADAARRNSRWWWCYALLLLPLPIRTVAMANVDAMVLYPEQSMPVAFIRHVEALERELGRPVVVSTHRLAGHPWALQRRILGGEGDANAHSWPHGLCDVLVLPTAGLGLAPTGYVVAESAPGNQLDLLMREPPLYTEVVLDTAIHIETMTTGASAPISLPGHLLRAHDLFVELRGAITSDADPLDLRLTIAVRDSMGLPLHGDLVFLNTRREAWHGETWRTIRHIPKAPAAQEALLYFNVPDGQSLTLTEGRLIVRTARP